MCILSVSGSESHWGVSQYLEFPWLLEAKAETARLMRVFMDMDPREILENADEFFNVLECMYVVVTDGPCYFKGEDLETWRKFHTWVRTTLKDMYPDDPDFDEDWVRSMLRCASSGGRLLPARGVRIRRAILGEEAA